jgi:hypothetical protein
MAVRDAVWAVNRDAVVVTLNINKVMQCLEADGTVSTWPIVVNAEVGDTIADMLAKNNLAGRPLVVTGFICIGMGQSLVCKSLGTFSSAIVSHEDLTNEDLYQLLGRTAANSKDWEMFRETTIYCPESTMHRCIAMERVAYSMYEDQTRPDRLTLADLNAAAGDDEAGKAALAHIRVKKAPKKDAPPPEDIRMSIPIVVSVTDAIIEDIHSSGNTREGREKVIKLLPDDVAKLLSGYTCKQVTRPRADLQYQKAVTDVVLAGERGRRPGLFTKEEKKTNVWQVILDERFNRVVVTYYRGVL